MSSHETEVPRDSAAEAWHPFEQSSRPYTNYIARALWNASKQGDSGEDVMLRFYDKTHCRVAVDILESHIEAQKDRRPNIAQRYRDIKEAYEEALQNP